ncbi:MAG: branched-chain amino acid ABC transporter permease [Nitrospinota bacterium]|nr:MAG: branched-chain amino acid ABC transporter permease [Nitrospinota bacterium]
MFYRECGQFKTTYADDMAIFPIAQDRWGVIGIILIAFIVVPLVANDYWLTSILIPFLIYSLAALGLNLLTGYCGQLSIGHAAFMAVGAYSAFNLAVRLHPPLLLSFLGGGLIAAVVGVIFGLPSLRIKGFYLAVATLAAQFTIEWVISHVSWISGENVLGAIDTPPMVILNWQIDAPVERYLLCLSIVILLTLFAKNLVRSEIGRSWMAIRDRDVAAEIIGINLFRNKLLAFAISSFYAGVAGALLAFAHLRSVEVTEFDLFFSFRLLGMIIIGGLGSILGSFLGAAFIVLLPIFINRTVSLFAQVVLSDLLSNLELMIFGGLIIFFLIVEPYGLARLWLTIKSKLRLWPFPY